MRLTSLLAFVSTLAASLATTIIGSPDNSTTDHGLLMEKGHKKYIPLLNLVTHPDYDCLEAHTFALGVDKYLLAGPHELKGGMCWSFTDMSQSVSVNTEFTEFHECEFKLYQARLCDGEMMGLSITEDKKRPSCVWTEYDQEPPGAYAIWMQCKKGKWEKRVMKEAKEARKKAKDGA